jgi:hypothetical protein
VRFHPLTKPQRWGWYLASFISGFWLIAVAVGDKDISKLLADQDFGILLIFSLLWLAGVVALRLYIQDKDPADLLSILGLRRSKSKK